MWRRYRQGEIYNNITERESEEKRGGNENERNG
jgi:hypothetical protein